MSSLLSFLKYRSLLRGEYQMHANLRASALAPKTSSPPSTFYVFLCSSHLHCNMLKSIDINFYHGLNNAKTKNGSMPEQPCCSFYNYTTYNTFKTLARKKTSPSLTYQACELIFLT